MVEFKLQYFDSICAGKWAALRAPEKLQVAMEPREAFLWLIQSFECVENSVIWWLIKNKYSSQKPPQDEDWF